MQKKIIALAVAGLVSGVAFAQTNVTVYGIADVCYGYSKSDTNNGYLGLGSFDGATHLPTARTNSGKFMGINSGCWSGSRIGFRGEEGLGNGLKAVFTLEYGTNIDQNASGWDQIRQSFVGLAGNWGTVAMGRQYAPSGMFLGATSVNDITTVQPSNFFVPAFRTMQTGGGSRWNNAITYHSPNWNGFDFRAIAAFGEQTSAYATTTGWEKNDTSDGNQYGLGVRYANGPLYLTAMYQQVMSNDAQAVGGFVVESGDNKAWSLGGSYDFKVVKVFANYIQEKQETFADSDYKKQYWGVGVGIPVSAAGQIQIEYGQYKLKNYYDSDPKAKGVGIGYVHEMSKRTRLYTTLSYIDNDSGLAFGGLANNGNGAGTALGQGGGSSQFGEKNYNFVVGVRHLF